MPWSLTTICPLTTRAAWKGKAVAAWTRLAVNKYTPLRGAMKTPRCARYPFPLFRAIVWKTIVWSTPRFECVASMTAVNATADDEAGATCWLRLSSVNNVSS